MEGSGHGRLFQGQCSGCSAMLMFSAGLNVVECARCGGLTAQATCPGCNVTLMFPPAAPSVECAVCGMVSQFGPNGEVTNSEAGLMAHIVCSSCQIHLMYPRNADSVLCGSCHHVTPTAVPLDQEQQKRMIIIQNPDQRSTDALVVGYAPAALVPPAMPDGASLDNEHENEDGAVDVSLATSLAQLSAALPPAAGTSSASSSRNMQGDTAMSGAP